MNLTVAVIAATVVILIAYDVWTIVRRGYTTTISWVILSWSKRFPVIAFALGFLFGHLVWENAVPGPDCGEVAQP